MHNTLMVVFAVTACLVSKYNGVFRKTNGINVP